MITRIDLNCDMGEIHPKLGTNYDELIMPYITSCNICCAAHSGTVELTKNTISKAIDSNLSIGAHPSYPDKINFGRISKKYPKQELKDSLTKQITLVAEYIYKVNGKLSHIKPHGALYNDMIVSDELTNLFIEVIEDLKLEVRIMGFADSTIGVKVKQNNLMFINEVFADRKYENQNALRSRKHLGSVLENEKEVLEQIDGFLNGYVIDYHNRKHSITAESICLHSDTPNAIELSKKINEFLKAKHVQILPY